jgi:hypothetical protein
LLFRGATISSPAAPLDFSPHSSCQAGQGAPLVTLFALVSLRITSSLVLALPCATDPAPFSAQCGPVPGDLHG